MQSIAEVMARPSRQYLVFLLSAGGNYLSGPSAASCPRGVTSREHAIATGIQSSRSVELVFEELLRPDYLLSQLSVVGVEAPVALRP